jgi:hypothetical protein
LYNGRERRHAAQPQNGQNNQLIHHVHFLERHRLGKVSKRSRATGPVRLHGAHLVNAHCMPCRADPHGCWFGRQWVCTNRRLM